MYYKLRQIRGQLTEMLGLGCLHGEHQMAQWVCDTTTKICIGVGIRAETCQQLTFDEHNALPKEAWLARAGDCLGVAIRNIDALEQPVIEDFSLDITNRAEATVDMLMVETTKLLRKLRAYQAGQ